MINQKRALINGIVIGIVLILGMWFMLKTQHKTTPETTTSGQAAIGGAFTLTDDTGTIRSNSDFLDNYMLVYFGYSYCPDVCPIDLQKISLTLETLEDNGVDTSLLQPLFITVDPERDTPLVMHEYLENFHPKILGLSGSLEEVKVAAQAYRVYFNKADMGDDGSYLMNHSSVIYLMGKDGQYIRHFSPDESPQGMADALSAIFEDD